MISKINNGPFLVFLFLKYLNEAIEMYGGSYRTYGNNFFADSKVKKIFYVGISDLNFF